MNDEILKLAIKEFGEGSPMVAFQRPAFERFYRAAFNAGIEAAAKMCDDKTDIAWNAGIITLAIRELEMK